MNITKTAYTVLFSGLTFATGSVFGAGNPVRDDAFSSEEIVMNACTAVTALTPACTYVPLDLIGDANTDLLVGNNNGQDLQLYPGDGAGGFGNYSTLGSGVRASGLRVVDLDGDGDLDILKSVRGTDGDPTVGRNLYYTNVAGTFSQGDISTDADRSTSIDIGDLDLDGDPDVIVSNTKPGAVGTVYTSNKVYLNTSAGPDNISFAAGVSIDPVNPGGTTGSGDNSRRIVLLDIDRDGDLDAVAANDDETTNDNRVYINMTVENAGVFSFAAPVNLTASLLDDSEITNTLLAVDLDGAGGLDLVATNFGQPNRYYINNTPVAGVMDFDTTNDTFGSATDLSTNVRAADLDQDGDMDLVTTSNPGTNRVHINLGADPNRFGDPTGADDDPAGQGFLLVDPVMVADATELFTFTRGLDFADLNGDGFPDLITANRDGQRNLRYLNNALDPTNIDGDVCPASPGPPADGCHPFRNMTPRPTPDNLSAQNNTPVINEDETLVLDIADVDVLDPDNTTGDLDLTADPGANYTVSADTLSITPDPNFNGPLSVTVRISDQEERSPAPHVSFSVTVTSVEDAPQYTSPALLTATQDAVYTYNVVASDGDGDAVTMTAPTLPAWLTFTPGAPGTATLTGTPTNAEVGDHAVSLAVTDPDATPDPDIGPTQDFTITVANVNDAPSFTSMAGTAATAGMAYNYAITTTDPDLAVPSAGEMLTISAAAALPGWLTLTDAGDGTATLGGTPTAGDAGDAAISLQVQDAGGAAPVTQDFTITVGTDSPPTVMLTGTNPQLIANGAAYTELGATASDAEDGDISANIVITGVGAVDTSTAGDYTVTYTVTDSSGNMASANRTVTVAAAPTPTPTPAPRSTGGGGSTGLGELAGLALLTAFGAIRRRRRDWPRS